MNAHTFRPDRTHILAIVLIAMIAIIGIAWAPLKLGWLLIFPVLWIWWVLKAHTTVSEDGIDIGYAFRGNEHLDTIAPKQLINRTGQSGMPEHDDASHPFDQLGF